jgi:membrane fusion protein (multidrug efflux system)
VVQVEPAETDDIELYGEYVGRIRAQQFVEIRARVEGFLEKMLFEEGTYVKKGQPLFIIDPKLYEARVNKAKAQLNKDKALELKADRDLKRIRPLYEQNAASQLDLDNAIASYESATASVAMSEADLTQAETALSYTTVSSPLSGYISERSVDIGTLVGPNGKSLLATVVKSDTVRVDFSMTGLDYLKSKARNVNLGQKDSTRKWDPYITITLADNTQYPLRDWSTSPIRRSTPKREPSPCAPKWPTPTASCCRDSSRRCACCSTCAKTPRSCRPSRSSSRRAAPTSSSYGPTASPNAV